MNLLNVRDGFVTLDLLADNCIVLAAACEAAYWNLSSAKDPRLGALLMAFEVALEAAAMAASEDNARGQDIGGRHWAASVADRVDNFPPSVDSVRTQR